jgi:hypothetical protein
MAALIAGRTASPMPGLDIVEQRSWQNFVDSTLRLCAMLNRRLTEVHQLSLFDVRVLDMLDNDPAGSCRMGGLAEALPSVPSRLTHQIRRPRGARAGPSRAEQGRPAGLTPLPLSAVAWQSGLMHSP